MQAEVKNPRWRLTNTGNTHISACTLRSCTILTAKLMYSRPKSAVQLCFIVCTASGNQKSKMAAHKQEILISEPAYNVAAQLHRLYPWFLGPGCQRGYSLYCVMQAEIRNQRWRLTNRKYLYQSLYPM